MATRGPALAIAAELQNGALFLSDVIQRWAPYPTDKRLDQASLRHFRAGGRALTIPTETIRFPAIASPHHCQRTEPGIDGLARTNLRFSREVVP